MSEKLTRKAHNYAVGPSTARNCSVFQTRMLRGSCKTFRSGAISTYRRRKRRLRFRAIPVGYSGLEGLPTR